MSSDNYILIRKEGREYIGYHQSASADEENFECVAFMATSLKDAIKKAQAEYTEYGYRIDFGEVINEVS